MTLWAEALVAKLDNQGPIPESYMVEGEYSQRLSSFVPATKHLRSGKMAQWVKVFGLVYKRACFPSMKT